MKELLDYTALSSPEPANCPPNWWEGYGAGAAMAYAVAAKKIREALQADEAAEKLRSFCQCRHDESTINMRAGQRCWQCGKPM